MAAVIKVIVETTGGVDNIRKDLSSLGKEAAGAGSGFSSLREIAVGSLREIGSLAVHALGAAASAVGGFLKDSVGAAAEFETGMNNFAVAAGDSLDAAGLKVDDFSDLFLKLGKELPVSTKEVQDAAIVLVKGGLDPAIVAAGGLESSLKFAAAAGMDLAGAAELSIKQLATFVPSAADAATKTAFLAHAQDLLVKAAGASTLDVDKLGDAMLAAGGSAKASGVVYEDFVTTMGLISPQFSSAAEAGTSYKNFLTRLIPTTRTAKDRMRALGLVTEDGKSKFYDATGAFVGNRQAAEMLKQALGGLSAEERAGAVATIFGNDAKGAAIALMDEGADGYDRFADAMNNASGVMATAEGRQKGFNFALTNLKGTFEALQIVIGTKVLPVFTPLMLQANDMLGVVLDITQSIFGASDPLLTFAQLLNDISPGLSNIAYYLIEFARGGEGMKEWLAATPQWFQAFIGAIQTVSSVIHDVASTISEPLGLIKTQFETAFAYDGIAGVIQLVIDKLSTISPGIAIMVGVIQAAIPVVLAIVGSFQAMASSSGITTDTVATAFQVAQGMVASAVTEILGVVRNAFGIILQYIPFVMFALQQVIGAVLANVLAFWQKNGTDILKFATDAWNSIKTIISAAVELIMLIVIGTFALVADFIQKHGDAIQTILGGAWSVIKGVIGGALAIIKGLVTVALAIIKGDWEGAWTAVKEMASGVWGAIKDIIGGALEVIFGLFNSSIEKWLGSWRKGWDDIKAYVLNIDWAAVGVSIIDGMTGGILSKAMSLYDTVKNVVNDALNAAKDALGISSPSAVFAREVGFPSAQGIAVGLARGAPMIAQAGAGAAHAAVAGATTYNNYSLNFAPNYSGSPSERMDYRFAKSLAGVA